MTETMLRTLLGEKILRHWREHCPQMVRDLEKQNRLDQTVFEAQERTGDLLYELVSVKKMKRASRTGPLAEMNDGITLVAPESLASAT